MKIRLLDNIPLISNRTKIKISISLLFFAFIICIFRPNTIDSKICLIAMFFSFLGDVALNCKPLEKRSHSLLYIGAFFFMISHLIYAAAYHFIIVNSSKSLFNPGMYIACVIMCLIFIVSIICIRNAKRSLKPSMALIFTIYTIMISINFVTIYSYSWNFQALSFIGATSFLISDYIIGIETVFKIKSATMRKLVWIFYPIGQILILLCR